MKSKIASLLVQWVWCFASSPSGWVAFFSYRVFIRFHTCVDAVLANPSAFHSALLPPFYRAFLSARWKIEGSYSRRCSSLVGTSLSPHHCCPVAEVSAKHVYQFLLSENRCPPPPPATVLRNCVLSMVIYTGPPPGAGFFVCT